MADQNNNHPHRDTVSLDPADGLPYITELEEQLFELLAPAQNCSEVESRLRKLYPNSTKSNVINGAIEAANKQRADSINHRTHSSSASFTGTIHKFAVQVQNLVRDGSNRNEHELSKYKTTFVKYIIDELLGLACRFVERQGSIIITRKDIRLAMYADEDFVKLFLDDVKILSIIESNPILSNVNSIEKAGQRDGSVRPTTYKQKLIRMKDSESSFQRDLKLLIKVFKAQLERLPGASDYVQIIFCNIDDILELSNLMISTLEDALDSVGHETSEVPLVGREILDLAQAEEFHAYHIFANKRLDSGGPWREAYSEIVGNEQFMVDHKFDLAVRHLLPNYLLNVLVQFFEYFRNISELYELSKENGDTDDALALRDTISILSKTKQAIVSLLIKEMDNEEVEPLAEDLAKEIKSMMQKSLEAELKREQDLPLIMPPPSIYRFSEPDSRDNIQFEESKHLRNQSDIIPVIRCASLLKLVERLTYHRYHPDIVDSFLITYRSFTTPEELLDLLIERFYIPNPPVGIFYKDFPGSQDELPEMKLNAYKLYTKRFYQHYSKPVKMRVINVLKSWVKNHFYDFEPPSKLLDKLECFLDEIYEKDKVLRGLIVPIKSTIKTTLDQKRDGRGEGFEVTLPKLPPILWFAAKKSEPEKFDILTLHPREFARQLTLIEFNLFRAIKPSELINVRDLGMRSKADRKQDSSPNLTRLTRHFTLFSYWIRKCIVETEEFEKRAAIYNRAIEIMSVLLTELNNHTGLLSIGSAIESAPIKRLTHTHETLSKASRAVLTEYQRLTADHQKNLQHKLKNCNPPCIPYLGSYQTKLIHAKEGNRTFMDEIDTTTISPTLSNDEFHSSFSNSPATPISPRTPRPMFSHISSPNPPNSATSTIQNQFFAGPPPSKMINFYKQRIRASLVAEISNYQNPPYCLEPEPTIREYIESIEPMMVRFAIGLDPRDGDENYWIEPNVTSLTKRLDDYLFAQSERIEPKNSKRPPKSLSKVPDCWKSPGVR